MPGSFVVGGRSCSVPWMVLVPAARPRPSISPALLQRPICCHHFPSRTELTRWFLKKRNESLHKAAENRFCPMTVLRHTYIFIKSLLSVMGFCLQRTSGRNPSSCGPPGPGGHRSVPRPLSVTSASRRAGQCQPVCPSVFRTLRHPWAPVPWKHLALHQVTPGNASDRQRNGAVT